MALHLGAHAQTAQDINAEQLRRAQERESLLRQQQEAAPDVHLPTPSAAAPTVLPPDESPCFAIRQLQLSKPDGNHFDWLIEQADGHAQLDRPDPIEGRCLGAQGIQTVIDRLQNALVAKGYVTSRVLAV